MIIPVYEVWGDSDGYKQATVTPHDSDYGSIEIKVFQHWICEASDNEVRLIIHDLEQAKSFITAIKEVVRNVENYQKESES